MIFLKKMFDDIQIRKWFFEALDKYKDDPALSLRIRFDGIDVNDNMFNDLEPVFKILNDPKSKTRAYLILRTLEDK